MGGLASFPRHSRRERCVQVMDNKGLLEAAVQATLTCDALSLRFQMPPYGTPSPEPRADPAVARGTPCTPIQVLTSVWVVSVLRTIAKDPANRLLPLLGIGAVSTQPVLGFTDDDAVRYQLLQSQQPLLGCIPLVRPRSPLPTPRHRCTIQAQRALRARVWIIGTVRMYMHHTHFKQGARRWHKRTLNGCR